MNEITVLRLVLLQLQTSLPGHVVCCGWEMAWVGIRHHYVTDEVLSNKDTKLLKSSCQTLKCGQLHLHPTYITYHVVQHIFATSVGTVL
jgi:hypothetical protein